MKHRKHLPTERSDITPPVGSVADFNQKGIGFPLWPEDVARRAYFTYVNADSAPRNPVQHLLEAEAQIAEESDRTPTHVFQNRT